MDGSEGKRKRGAAYFMVYKGESIEQAVTQVREVKAAARAAGTELLPELFLDVEEGHTDAAGVRAAVAREWDGGR